MFKNIMLNNQWLNTFITLVDVGHFTQTSEKLFMTQPGVSQHIKKLEEQVGTLLLQRIGKKFELTQAGEALYNFGRLRATEEADLLISLKTDNPYSGDCRFGCSGSMAMFLYPKFLSRQSKHPELHISIEAAPDQRIINEVLNNNIDIGIITQHVISTELEQESLGHDALCLVVPHQYKNQKMTFVELNQLGFINHPNGEQYAEQVLRANYKDDYQSIKQIRKSSYINQLNQILLPVSMGLGYTVLPRTTIEQFELQDSIAILPSDTVVNEEHFLIKKKFRQLPKRYQWFIDLIKKQ
ncbi:LysR family transcriptional regulator [Photobacterium profundum]|uniref:Hypothetical LysR, Transcriptional regulator n=1 Tax=Photobacterium profundum (strain SS9) TaxID=298386 RepID=Q6LIJ1_PHOPR|nr:LysR family transcriptional regulator [Photobacterium profundum]CAG22889.1 hypothetical LysR, Transcriptional regulator [Photobacterium profundum SS9]